MAPRPTGNAPRKIILSHVYQRCKESMKAENYFSAESMVILYAKKQNDILVIYRKKALLHSYASKTMFFSAFAKIVFHNFRP